MKKLILILLIIVGAYLVTSNFPKGTYGTKWGEVSISMRVTDNFLAVRDPVCNKYITIKDGDEVLKFGYWAETYPVAIYKRQNDKEEFWVIDDHYRGVARSRNGTFDDFECPGCSGIKSTYGKDIFGWRFDDKEWVKIDFRNVSDK